jgi:hypothetical protein
MDCIKNGGEGGIRTHGTDKGPLVFKTSAFDHSATSPVSRDLRSERIHDHSPWEKPYKIIEFNENLMKQSLIFTCQSIT